MIRFNCHCTHEFLVSEDQAGGMVQCPKCSRLNDVPTLSDLANLDEEGGFKISEGPKPPDKTVLPTAARAFTRDTRDDRGEEIDMRPSVEEFLNLGREEVPLSLADEERPGAPKYDPLTGELVETLDIKPAERPIGPDAKSIPVAKRAVSYATQDLNVRVTPLNILGHLFRPVNLTVMLFVVLTHVLLQVVLSVVMAGIFFAAPIVIAVFALLKAHYGIIIEEIASGDADELPRPLRDVSFSQDIWAPWIRVNFSILVCFWPEIFTLRMAGPMGTGLLVSCVMFGAFFLPAVLMTTLCAGSYLNLRPDRIIGVIRASGLGYWVAVSAFAIAGTVYLSAIGFVTFSFMKLFGSVPIRVPLTGLAIGTPVLLLGIYLMHFACWHLGLLCRANRDRFPWILQRHVSTRRTDTLAQLEAARKAAQMHDALRARRPDREQRIAEIRTAEKAKRNPKDAKPIWDRVAESPRE